MQTFEEFKKEWLSEITEGNPSSVELGNRFARKLIMQWLDTEDDPANLIFCDGSGDGGIDVAFLYKGDNRDEEQIEGDTWYLIQSKYGKAFAGSGTIMTEGRKVIETLEGKKLNLSSLAEGLLEKLKNFRLQANSRDKIILVFATVDPLSESEKKILNDIKLIGKDHIGLLFDVDSISVNTIYLRNLESSPEFRKNIISFSGNLVSSGPDLMVGSIKLINLYNFLREYRNETGDLDLLYEKNVRKFLGGRKKVNRGIAETLKENPEKFGLYNNGITIVVEDFNQLESDKYQLTEPYIVNGCQTTRTIWETLSAKLDSGGTGVNPEVEKWKERLNRGIVVVKVVKVGAQGEELLVNTTRYTNSQNAISQKDFIALESNFKTWAREMGNEYDVYLEIQRGGWDSQRLYQRQNLKVKQFTQWVNAFDLLKVYGAGWLSEPGLAFGKNPPFAPGGTMFKRIVERDTFNLNDLYAAYLLYKLSNKIQFGRRASKPSRGQTRHLFYYVIVELLKECLIQATITVNEDSITEAIIKIFNDLESPAATSLSEAALNVIDDYLTKENEDCVFSEPNFTGDLNAFMKSDKLGKGSSETPKLHNLIAFSKHVMRKRIGDQAPSRDIVIQAVKQVNPNVN